MSGWTTFWILILALFVVDRLGLWAERRGWVYWRKQKPTGGGGMGAALGQLQTVFQPSHKYVLEMREQQEVEAPSDKDLGLWRVRKAKVSEAFLLGQLALSSKAYWPYSKEFIKKCEKSLEVEPQLIEKGFVYVIENDIGIAGFYSFCDRDGPEMISLFVDPKYIGKGIGKKLWTHALGVATKRNWSSFKIVADPYAADRFYYPKGCTKIGEVSSEVQEGRLLPLLEYVLHMD